jgi:translation elongation factor EF-1alpha
VKIITQETPCRVSAIRRRIDSSSLEVIEADAAALENTEVAEVELGASAPVVVEPVTEHPSLGRVVLERQGGVVGAGIILGS